MAEAISLDIVSVVAEEMGQGRFKWRLRARGETEMPPQESFPTKREAAAQGQIALQRAVQRGRIGRYRRAVLPPKVAIAVTREGRTVSVTIPDADVIPGENFHGGGRSGGHS
ncbi:hypothetical protein JNW90_34225 [Micromonospora sp. STR1s_5]|nr:hypothetical protein [Micromonospora sp. STR1s_5]